MSMLLVSIIAFYAVFITEVIHATHHAIELKAPEAASGQVDKALPESSKLEYFRLPRYVLASVRPVLQGVPIFHL